MSGERDGIRLFRRPADQLRRRAGVLRFETTVFCASALRLCPLHFRNGRSSGRSTGDSVARLRDCSMSLTHELPPPIRVLIADDSAVMRTALSRMLDANPQIRVCGTARNGQEAVEKTKLLQPDVITLDVEMPVLNGVEALKRIMSECPCPVTMVSSVTRAGADVTIEALSAGAFDYLAKEALQPGRDAVRLQHDLIEKIEAAF